MKVLVSVAVFGLMPVPPMPERLSSSVEGARARSQDYDFLAACVPPRPVTERLATPEAAGAMTPARRLFPGPFSTSPYRSDRAGHRFQTKQRRTTMKTIGPALIALCILAGIASQVNAADMSDSKSWEQPVREIH